ncbi:Uncharacterised protein [Brucella abortus]|nr:Uncharacterised protein [Brucella abortus]
MHCGGGKSADALLALHAHRRIVAHGLHALRDNHVAPLHRAVYQNIVGTALHDTDGYFLRNSVFDAPDIGAVSPHWIASGSTEG